MLVYRFETDRGVGPWSSSDVLHYITASMEHGNGSNPYNMPTPSMEVEHGTELHRHHSSHAGKLPANIVFGFACLDTLTAAFSCPFGRREMHRMGCKMRLYEVPEEEVWKGNAQVAFNKDRARLIATLAPTDFHILTTHSEIDDDPPDLDGPACREDALRGASDDRGRGPLLPPAHHSGPRQLGPRPHHLRRLPRRLLRGMNMPSQAIYTFDHPLPLDVREDARLFDEPEGADFAEAEGLWEDMAFGRRKAATPTEGGAVW